MSHAFLALSCLALLLVIAAQDWLYPPLRNETISAGLTGRYHVALDVSYVPLAAALCLNFSGHPLMRVFAVVSAVALILVAATNTAWRWFDLLTDGAHSTWHSHFTLTVFTCYRWLEITAGAGG